MSTMRGRQVAARQGRNSSRRRARPKRREAWQWVIPTLSVIVLAAGVGLNDWANRRQVDAAIKANNDQQSANRSQLDVAREGQITERFGRAIDQLGQEDAGEPIGQGKPCPPGLSKLSIRLGGIYSMSRLMRDSPPDEDSITEVLSAFIRSHADPKNCGHVDKDNPATDVQAALTVLGARPDPTHHQHIDLGIDTNLIGADLDGAHLEGVDLTGTDLGQATMGGAWLAGATLKCTYLTDVDLSTAHSLTSEQLSQARIDSGTVLPKGVVGPSRTDPACL